MEFLRREMRSEINVMAYSKTKVISLINCLKVKHCIRGRTDPQPIRSRFLIWLDC